MVKLLRILVALVLVTGAVAVAYSWYTSRDTLPSEIRIAAGQRDGLYNTFAREFATRLQSRTSRPVRVIETVGSEANVELLQGGGAELALTQTTSLKHDGLAGIAPLFPEPLHFLVRKDTGIRTPADLAGRRVALGLKGSSIRQNAIMVLGHYGVQPQDIRDEGNYFGELDRQPGIDATLVTTGWMNPVLMKLLHRDDLNLIGIADPEGVAARYPWFTVATIPRGLYPGKTPQPVESLKTVAVTALLAGRDDASDRLVRESLATLYETDLRASYPSLLTAKVAKDYDAATMHPGVANYHDPSAGFKRISRIVELLSKSKEVLFGLVAAGIFFWGWLRRRREREELETERVQKQKLDEFIDRTLTVELEQMDETNPERLRPYLRRVTQIKQDALKELTSEKVRGDQLFAIFLSQCAALSEKIQMRMVYGRISEQRSN